MPVFRFLLPVLIALAVAACSTTSGAALEADAGAAQRAEMAAERWELAVRELRQQPSASAAASLRSAGEEAREAIQQCLSESGCDSAPLLQRYADLLLLQGDAWAELAAGDAFDVEAASDEAIAGEPAQSMGDDLPELGKTITLLKGQELRDLIELNEPVRAALNEWLTWMRPQLIEAHENYQFLRHRMWPEYEQAGLPEALLFGILAKESAGKVHAVSRAGAAGPLQFMPATGARFGLGRDAQGFDTRFDPQLAARANVHYLNERFSDFNNDLALSLAAYNGGEGRMRRLYRDSRKQPFWSNRIRSALPAETRDYVPMVLAAAWLFLHPQDYGLEFPTVDSGADDLPLQQPASINQLAVCLGQEGTRSGWFRALRNLNPRYLAHTELPSGTVLRVPTPVVSAYRTHCLSGERALAARQVAQAAIAHQGSSAVVSAYQVRHGDTLASIARRHQCTSAQSLAAANGIAPPRYLIKPGQTLQLQGCRS